MDRSKTLATVTAAILLLAYPVMSRDASGAESAAKAPPGQLASSEIPVMIAAGDIAACNNPGDEATAALLDGLDGTIISLGDNAYNSGSATEFAQCFDPSWGRHKARIRPAPGNHDYGTRGAAGYYGYFGDAAGEPGKGYYSYDVDTWHVVVINSECGAVGGCGAGSPQEQWVRQDLAAHPAACTLAYWHHPYFSSGQHGSDPRTQAIWQALYEAGADVVLVGHDHMYERFAPQTPAGVADPDRGIRQFTVGTGGKNLYRWQQIAPNSEVRENATHGVLKLTLHPTAYDWEFIPIQGKTFTDSGSGVCH